MLSQNDIEWIKSNRAELTSGRTESITLIREVEIGADQYTGETIIDEVPESVSVIWKEVSTVANGERDVVNGVELQNGDVQVTFDGSVGIENVKHIVRGGVEYSVVTVDEKGIGTVNRRECIARRTT